MEDSTFSIPLRQEIARFCHRIGRQAQICSWHSTAFILKKAEIINLNINTTYTYVLRLVLRRPEPRHSTLSLNTH